MRKLIFRSFEAMDGRKFAFLTDQPEVEYCFDGACISAYEDLMNVEKSKTPSLLKDLVKVESTEFSLVSVESEISQEIIDAFDSMISNLVKGIDVFFCDYNLGVEGDLPMCNNVMELYPSTDFVLFSCADIVGQDPKIQPYMVSYAAPRYETGIDVPKQHRIYCQTDSFAFRQAILAIVGQREKDDRNSARIRADQDSYVGEARCSQGPAQTEMNRFVALIQRLGGDAPKALEGGDEPKSLA